MHHQRRVLAAAIACLLAGTTAHAFEISTENSDLAVRWDNTVRYNLGYRAQAQDARILGNPNFDDGDRNFSKGSIVTNRIDLLSEFDVVFKRSYGFRASAAAWGDAAYGSLDNANTATANTLRDGVPVAGELSPYSRRYSKGPSGELLDAFAFANFEIGDIPVNIKAGQHTVFWGDSLLLGGAVHSVSYGQYALDLQKGFTTPGSEAKELFRPRGAITIQAQPAQTLSIAAQWFYNWQAVRIPESGNYLTIQDGLNFGGDSVIVGANPFFPSVPGTPPLLRAWNNQSTKSSVFSSHIGDFGLSGRWSPEWLDGGTMGFYARNTTEILPQVLLIPGLAANVPAGTCTAIGGQALPGNACIINRNATTLADIQKYGKFGQYQTAYGDDIHIFGISLARQIAGVSVAGELSYRQNMPLQSNLVNVVPAPLVPTIPGSIATTAIPEGTPGAVGDTYHGLVNALNIFPKTAVFDTATLAAELTWMQWSRVTQNFAAFKGNPSYTGIDKVSKNFFGLAINFTPTWFQVLPGVDLSAPITWSQGLSGNAAVQLGGNKGTGNWSAGIAADIYQKYRVQLGYNGYYGDYSLTPAGTMNVANGTSASLSDRGWYSLTFKTTF